MGLSKGQFSLDELVDDLNSVLDSVNQASYLTQQMLGFSKMGKYNPVDLDLNITLKEVSKIISKGFSSTTFYKIKCLAEAKKYIHADATQMHQVIYNLVINAKQSMPKGGTITLASKNVLIKEKLINKYHTIPKGNYIKLSVTDQGTGIKKENLNKIFDPFFTTKTEYDGTGLGLATVWGIANNHNAYLDIETKENEGTTFNIYFAVVKTKHKLKKNNSVEILHKGKILVIDDDKNIRNILRRYFKHEGYNIVIAENGVEGLNKYRESNDFDVVLSDLIMKPMDGIELYDNIKKLNPEVIFYVMSGSELSKIGY